MDIYQPSTGQWSSATLSHPRRGIAAVAVGDRGYFLGGESDAIDIYQASTDHWYADHLLFARTGAAAGAIGNLLVVAAGDNSAEPSTLQTAELIDTVSGTKRAVTLSEPRRESALSVVGSKAYISGGYHCAPGDESDCAASGTIDVYDATTDSITTLAMPHPRAGHRSVAAGSRIFLVGGAVFLKLSDTLDILDTTTGAWTSVAVPKLGICGAVVVGDFLIAAGGNGDSASAITYHLPTGALAVKPMSTNRYHFGSAAVGSLAYFSGGHGWKTLAALRDIEVFDAQSAAWLPVMQ